MLCMKTSKKEGLSLSMTRKSLRDNPSSVIKVASEYRKFAEPPQ